MRQRRYWRLFRFDFFIGRDESVSKATMNKALKISTIGYEGSKSCDFIATLESLGIKTLIDVRDVPVSRVKGFSKSRLAVALNKAGISYVHLKGLGDPKSGRDAARAGQFVTFRKIYSAHLKTAEAQSDLERAKSIVLSGDACLMCYERDPFNCHRSIVASIICDTLNCRVRHIGVQSNVIQGLRKERTRALSHTS